MPLTDTLGGSRLTSNQKQIITQYHHKQIKLRLSNVSLEEEKKKKEKWFMSFEARLGKQGKHFTLRYDQSIYVVTLSKICRYLSLVLSFR